MPCSRFQELDLAEFAVDPRAPEWAEFRDHFPRCVECSRDVARFGALAAALGVTGTSASAHPSDTKLLALARAPGDLARDERARLEAHLAGCAPCRTELTAARAFTFAKVAKAEKRRGWLGGIGMALVPLLRRPAFAAAMALVVAVLALVLTRQARETRPLPSPPPVAQVQPAAPAPIVAETPPKAEAAPESPPAPPIEPQPAPTQIAKQPTAEKPAVAKQPTKRETPAPVEAPAPAPAAPIQIAALLPAESPLYAPGPLASGTSVRIGGDARNVAAGAPAPVALGPEHIGASAHESPDLYWFLPEATPLSVEVTIVDPDAEEPLFEQAIPGPIDAGLHRVSLAEGGARLRPGVEYRWYVALVRNPARRSEDVVSGAAVRYTPPGPELAGRLSTAPPASVANLYAASGFWYDAFDQLSSWLVAEPGAAVLHQHRAALLDQVGLADAAAFERRAGTGPR